MSNQRRHFRWLNMNLYLQIQSRGETSQDDCVNACGLLLGDASNLVQWDVEAVHVSSRVIGSQLDGPAVCHFVSSLLN